MELEGRVCTSNCNNHFARGWERLSLWQGVHDEGQTWIASRRCSRLQQYVCQELVRGRKGRKKDRKKAAVWSTRRDQLQHAGRGIASYGGVGWKRRRISVHSRIEMNSCSNVARNSAIFKTLNNRFSTVAVKSSIGMKNEWETCLGKSRVSFILDKNLRVSRTDFSILYESNWSEVKQQRSKKSLD